MLAGCSTEYVVPGNANVGQLGGGQHHAVSLTAQSFREQVLSSSQVVLVDAWAPWCGPCLKLGPTIEELAEEYEGRAVVGKLNVDEASDIARQYNISSIPALLFFRNGKEVDRIEGIQPKAEIAARLDLLIGQ
jgi:thioredoxin 1